MNNRSIDIPVEIAVNILGFLNYSSFSCIGASNRFWSQAVNQSAVWEGILCKELHIQRADLNPASLQCRAKNIVQCLFHLKRMMSTSLAAYRNISAFFERHSKDALMIACLDDNVGSFMRLKKSHHMADVNINAWLDFACAYGAVSLVKYLTSLPDARQVDSLMLRLAAGSGNELLVEQLIEHQPDLTADEVTLEYGRQAKITSFHR